MNDIAIFQVPGHDDNAAAREALLSTGESFEVELRMPFVREPGGRGMHFGLEGIRRFARTIAARNPMAGARQRTDDNLRGVFMTNNRITRPFRKVRPHVTGEVQCVECGHRWEVERDGADIRAAERIALAEGCPRDRHHPDAAPAHASRPRTPKTKLGTAKVRRCADCTTRCSCTWMICPYEADVGGQTDPASAMWLCDDCQAERAADI